MAQTQIRGSTQILANSITLDRLVSGYSIPTSNLTQGSLFALTTGFTMSGSISMGSNSITGGTSPVNSTDYVIKSYVDALINGFTIHGARLLSSSNIGTLSGLLTVDGVTTAAGNIVLLIAQSTGSQNGPWVVSSGAWTRPTWWASGSTIPEGNYFIIDSDGTTYKNTKWFVTTPGTIVVDTTTIVLTQDSSGTSYTAGSGLLLSGTTFSAVTGNGITVTSNAITAVGDSTNLITVGSGGIAITTGSPGQVITGASSTGKASWVTISGDATLASGGGLIVTKTNGTAFAQSAITDTTNASNISSGTLGTGRLSGSYTGITGVGIIATGTWNGSTVGVGYGGTGAATFAAHGILIGEGTSTFNTAVGANGQLLLGNTSADPAFATMSGDVTITQAGVASVNNTAGSGYTKYTNFIWNETPSGAINGTNTSYTLANTPQNSSLCLYVNGELQNPGSGNDYTISGTTITMLYVLQSGDIIRANYVK